MVIDLNADLGEECGDDASLLEIVSSANIAVGGHAGGGAVMERTMRMAGDRGVRIGLHPSYPDPESFGRTSQASTRSRSELVSILVHQLVPAFEVADDLGFAIAHVKAHGALYHDSGQQAPVARALVQAIVQAADHTSNPVPRLMGVHGSCLAIAAKESGLTYLTEGFADRGYGEDGYLIPRGLPGAVLSTSAEVVAQARWLARKSGVDSICLHGDTPGAVDFARAVRQALEADDVRIAAPY